jgi:hypothetical protein
LFIYYRAGFFGCSETTYVAPIQLQHTTHTVMQYMVAVTPWVIHPIGNTINQLIPCHWRDRFNIGTGFSGQ